MSAWLEAYRDWPTLNQMIFSVILVLILFAFMIALGLWLNQVASNISIWLRGWPPEPIKTNRALPSNNQEQRPVTQHADNGQNSSKDQNRAAN